MVDELRALTERSREQAGCGPAGGSWRRVPARAQTSGDGSPHRLVWRQAADGQVQVLLDDEEAVNLRDRAFRDGYGLLELINRAGELAVRSITVLGSSTS
mgnify:FL=1